MTFVYTNSCDADETIRFISIWQSRPATEASVWTPADLLQSVIFLRIQISWDHLKRNIRALAVALSGRGSCVGSRGVALVGLLVLWRSLRHAAGWTAREETGRRGVKISGNWHFSEATGYSHAGSWDFRESINSLWELAGKTMGKGMMQMAWNQQMNHSNQKRRRQEESGRRLSSAERLAAGDWVTCLCALIGPWIVVWGFFS